MASMTASLPCRASESYILHPPSPKSSPIPEPCRHDPDPSGFPGIKVPTYVSCLPAVPNPESKERPAQDTLYEKAHYQIQKLRMRVTCERLQLRQQRVALRQQREKALDYEVRYYDALDRSWSKGGIVKHANLEKFRDVLHEARDKLGPMEEDYYVAEVDLDELEYGLEVQEKKFYTQSVGSPPTSTCSSSPGITQEDSRSYSAAEDSSPTTRYFDRLGDADILRERLEDLVEEQREHMEQEERRRYNALPPYAQNVIDMADFPFVYTEIVEELRQVEDDVRKLKDEAGIIDSHIGQESASTMPSSDVSVRQDPRALFEGAGDKSSSIPTLLHPPEFNYVLQNDIPLIPSHTSVTTISNTKLAQATAAEEERNNRNTLERISQWILDQLRSSKLEQARHKSLLDDIFLDDSEWWAHVEKFWPLDQAGGTLRPSFQRDSRASRSERSREVEIPTDGDSASDRWASTTSADMAKPTFVYPTTRNDSASSRFSTRSYIRYRQEFITSRSV